MIIINDHGREKISILLNCQSKFAAIHKAPHAHSNVHTKTRKNFIVPHAGFQANHKRREIPCAILVIEWRSNEYTDKMERHKLALLCWRITFIGIWVCDVRARAPPWVCHFSRQRKKNKWSQIDCQSLLALIYCCTKCFAQTSNMKVNRTNE